MFIATKLSSAKVKAPKILPDDSDRAAYVYRLAVLHKHWLHADSVQEHGRLALPIPKRLKLPNEFWSLGQFHSAFMVLSVWYALLYVVIEGYKELKLSDDHIDQLLSQTDYVDRLRRFRNSVFHYQSDPFPEKLVVFLETKDSEKWITDLNRAFKIYFERELGLAEWMDEIQKANPSPWGKFSRMICRRFRMQTR